MKKLLFLILFLPLFVFGQPTSGQIDACSGSATGQNSYSVSITCNGYPTSPAVREKICVTFTITNTGASTLKVNSRSAIGITLGGTALTSSDIVANQPYIMIYDVINNKWTLQKPSGSGGVAVSSVSATSPLSSSGGTTPTITITSPLPAVNGGTNSTLGSWNIDGNSNGIERWIGTSSNFDFPIKANNTTIMNIAKGGHVGIGTGTVTPLQDLTINPLTNAGGFAIMAQNGTDITTQIQHNSGQTDVFSMYANASATALIQLVAGTGGTCYINNAGKLGLGTDSPLDGYTMTIDDAATGWVEYTGSNGAYHYMKMELLGSGVVAMHNGSGIVGLALGTNAVKDLLYLDNITNFVGIGTTIPASNFEVVGNVAIDATKTVVNASTSGSVTYSQPLSGTSWKTVVIHCTAALGTASYTYPVAFTNTPSIIATSTLAAGIVTTLTTTSVTVTGATSTGDLLLTGY